MKQLFKTPRARRIALIIAAVVLLILLLWLYTYFFAKAHKRVIFQDSDRRIYLTEKKGYAKPGREIWHMVYEDIKTGARSFVFANAPKGYNEKQMCRRVLNTVEQGKKSSFDLVDRVGITISAGKSDVHSNLIAKKSVGEVLAGPAELFEGISGEGSLLALS